MANYYLNKNAQSNGAHEVHAMDCPHPAEPENRIQLGNFLNCASAVAAAKRRWPKESIDGCFYCANSCHTQ